MVKLDVDLRIVLETFKKVGLLVFAAALAFDLALGFLALAQNSSFLVQLGYAVLSARDLVGLILVKQLW